jgi:MGT family glycosyltransferase
VGTAVALIYPTHGHIAPVLGVVEELVRRGERVIFYATGRSRSRIESTGAEFRSYAVGHDAFSPTPPTDGLFSDMARLGALTEQLLPALSEQVRRDQPDYLLVDSKSLWGRLVGQVLETPAVTLSVVFAIQRGIIGVPDLVNGLYGGASREKMLAGLAALSRYGEIGRRLQACHGTVCPGIVEYLGNPQPLNIIFTSREFQLQGEAFGEEFQFVGPSIAPSRDASLDLGFEIADDRPLVYISLGTTFNNAPEFYRACFEAFAGAPWQVVLSTGKDSFQDLPRPPENFVVREFVPQLKVLERASLFLTHGGMNSANEGLYHGVPLLVTPQRGDQYLVGARVAELGAGLCLPPQNVTPRRLRETASEVLSKPQFRARAVALGKSLREAGGYRRAADAILSFAAKGASEDPLAHAAALLKWAQGLAAPVSP